nr:cytochrome P450 [Motilibacter deserti]
MPEFAADRLALMTRLRAEQGDAVPFRLGTVRALLLSDPAEIDAVLVRRNKEFGKHFLPLVGGSLLGQGLFTSTGDLWKRERRLTQPAFHRSRLAAYDRVMVRYAREAADSWADGEVRDVCDEMMWLTMRIVAAALFDADVAGDAQVVGDAMEGVRKSLSARLSAPIPYPEAVPTPTTVRLRRGVRRMDAIVQRFIDERRSGGVEGRDDLLSVLVGANDDETGGMSDRQLRDEVMTLFVGGHETTALALTWTWHLLAQRPDVLAAVREELDRVLDGRDATSDDVRSLTLLTDVIHESLRLFPPVYAFDRKVLADTTVAGHRLRKGTVVVISPWVVHRHPGIYDRPEEFRPERWAGGAVRRLQRSSYLPFGGGPRVCIGNGFAELEMVLVLATILQRLSFEQVSLAPPVPEASITLRPRDGLPLRVRP